MDRRHFIKKAGLAAAGGVAAAGLVSGCKKSGDGEAGQSSDKGGSGPAVHTGEKVRWRLASSFPRSLDTVLGAAEALAELVSAMTGGRFQIRVHSGGELVPALEVMDSVQQGSVEVSQTCSYYFKGKNPALVFDTTVPFGLTPRQQTAWLLEGGGQELIRELYADFGIINFVNGNTGCQMGGWFKREVNAVADIKGLRMRIPGLGGEVMSRLGASVQVIAAGEIAPALERGTIDAAEWIGPYDDEKLGFHELAKYYYYPGWWEPSANITLQVNRQAWDKLSAEYQAIFQAAAAASYNVMLTRYDHGNAAALTRLLDHGVEMRPYSAEIMTAAREATQALLDEQSAADAGYRKLYEHWKQARDAAFRWFGTTEMAYAQFMFSQQG
ncbi:TRAP transporter substrate-binding protein [Haliangium sp.]|uniref:TRAP transporter substrate-binding protein n=1 Tax=Haliangium sp. TaxID=2663208 RepID=UPI003D11DB9E